VGLPVRLFRRLPFKVKRSAEYAHKTRVADFAKLAQSGKNTEAGRNAQNVEAMPSTEQARSASLAINALEFSRRFSRERSSQTVSKVLESR